MPTVPAWLRQFANRVTYHLYAVDVLAPLGCHYYHNRARDQWEVTLFVSNSETVGGRFDGKVSSSRFTLNLLELQREFTTIEKMHWQPLQLDHDDQLGPCVSVEGTFGERNVWLRILATPPQDFEVGRYVMASSMQLEDRWDDSE